LIFEKVKKLTTATFIQNAQAVHGLNKYDYSQTTYLTNRLPVKIICHTHGMFETKAGSHIAPGSGCPKCANVSKGLKMKDYWRSVANGERNAPTGDITARVFPRGRPAPPPLAANIALERLTAVHGNRLLFHIDSESFRAGGKIKAECIEHGFFNSKYTNILGGSGCPKCAGQGLARSEWIARFRAQHGEKFDYSLLPDNVTARGKIDIICPLHGIFSQRAHAHHAGNGCLKCRQTNKQIGAGGWGRTRWQRVAKDRVCKLYCVRFELGGEVFFKVGITSESLERRFGRIPSYSIAPVFIHESSNPDEIWDLEHLVKRRFKHLRYLPALPFGGARECYSEIEQIISLIKESTKSPAA
jgi:hypothetical protein